MKAGTSITYFDANAWIGSWPFAMRPAETGDSLARRMQAAGISCALVSPLAAVLAPDPMPANRVLLEETKKHPDLFPAPVINPRLRIWREHLDACCADPRVRAIRIFPAWHGYTLRTAAVAEIAAELRRRNLGLIVTSRLEDERQQHFAIAVRGLRVGALDGFLSRMDPIPVLCTGLYRPEIVQLAPRANLLADLSMAEWDQNIENLLSVVQARQLCFGSLSPFLSLPANVAKIAAARVPASVRRKIAGENLRQFLRL